MKRIYACIAIFAAILCLAAYSNAQIKLFTEEISWVLYQAEEALEQEDLPAAHRIIAYGAEECREIRHRMETILKTDDFTELESYLRAACGYLENDALQETVGELRRASVEVERLARLASRIV